MIFVQVLFDEIYCMSYRRMRQAIEAGMVYENGDYFLDTQTGAGAKTYHRFLVDGPPHYCGRVAFPDDSRAKVTILPNGSVIPHIRFLPHAVEEIEEEVLLREIAYGSEGL